MEQANELPAFIKANPPKGFKPNIFISGGLAILFLEDVPHHHDWIVGEGADVSMIRAVDDNRVIGVCLNSRGATDIQTERATQLERERDQAVAACAKMREALEFAYRSFLFLREDVDYRNGEESIRAIAAIDRGMEPVKSALQPDIGAAFLDEHRRLEAELVANSQLLTAVYKASGHSEFSSEPVTESILRLQSQLTQLTADLASRKEALKLCVDTVIRPIEEMPDNPDQWPLEYKELIAFFFKLYRAAKPALQTARPLIE
jgi:hypothetical protein